MLLGRIINYLQRQWLSALFFWASIAVLGVIIAFQPSAPKVYVIDSSEHHVPSATVAVEPSFLLKNIIARWRNSKGFGGVLAADFASIARLDSDTIHFEMLEGVPTGDMGNAEISFASKTGEYNYRTNSLSLQGDVKISLGSGEKVNAERAIIDIGAHTLKLYHTFYDDQRRSKIWAGKISIDTTNLSAVTFHSGVRLRLSMGGL